LRKGQTGRQTGTEVMTDNSLTVIVKRRIVAGRRKQGDRHRLRKGLTGRRTGSEVMTENNYEEGRHKMSGDGEGARRATGTS
jgi:hypothetical protein